MTSFASARPTAGRESALARFNVRRAALPALLAAFVLLGSLYAVITPLFEVSDELWHYPMVKTLADGHGLPVQDPANPGPWRQEGSQPPLYYALMAVATGWINTSDLDVVRWINPHADNGVITPDGNNNILIHTAREAWPWSGTVLAVRLIRFLSVLMGAGTVYFTYRLALELAPGRDGLALAAAAFTAFTPMFVFISASVNNDNLAILLSAAILWLLARWLRAAQPRPAPEYVVMGVLLGAAALSKTSALGLWGLAGLVVVWTQMRRMTVDEGRMGAQPQNGWRQTILSVVRRSSFVFLFVFFPALALSGWWFLRNFMLYHDWLGWSAFLDTVGRRPHPASLLQLWGERVGFVQAYWGLFGGVSVPMPAWTYWVLNGLAALAAIGLVWAAVRAVQQRRVNLDQVVLWGLPLAWLVLILYGLVQWTSLTWASQGRLIFPAISAVGVLAAAGLTRLWRGLPWLSLAFMGVLTAAVPFTVIGPHYQPPPPLTAAQVAQAATPLNNGAGADFGGEMKLLGYRLDESTVAPGQSLHLTLYWQAEIAMDRNWSIFVHVVDDQGVIVAQRDRYPGNGALATTLMTPNEIIGEDDVIPIPDVTFAPASAHVEVGLYDLSDGTRLPLTTGADALALAPVSLAARAPISAPGLGAVPNPIAENFANQIELIGYDLDRRSAPAGQPVTLTLYWQARGPIAQNYSVFAHVRGEGETLWAGQDGWPQQGAAPTSTWQMGQIIPDTYQLVLKPDTPDGQYTLEVGLYDAAGVRLRVFDAGGIPTDNDFVYLSKLRVGAP